MNFTTITIFFSFIIILISCGGNKKYACTLEQFGGSLKSTFNNSSKTDCSISKSGISSCTSSSLNGEDIDEWVNYYREKGYSCNIIDFFQ